MTSLSATILAGEIGAVGLRMTEIDAAEGSAGNISVFARRLDSLDTVQERGSIDLPVAAPALAGGWLIVTGSACRLRDAATSPATTLCWLQIHHDGLSATLYAGAELRPTSELNSHLAIHNDQVRRRNLSHHAIVHAQPPYLTYLSHIERYSDSLMLNRRLLRWEPETIAQFPEGIGVLAFQMPGSLEQTEVTLRAMQTHRAVVWRRHGIVTRADAGVRKASDLVEYAETAARYEYLNLQAGEPSAGLSDAELRLICERWQIQQSIF